VYFYGNFENLPIYIKKILRQERIWYKKLPLGAGEKK
jgi:hypothetical protein